MNAPSTLHKRGQIGTSHHDFTNEKLAKRAHASKSCVVRVRCEGAIHAITWRVRGDFTLHGHDKTGLAMGSTLRAMGASKCRCVEIADAIKKNCEGLKGGVSKSLSDSINHSFRAREQRRHYKSEAEGRHTYFRVFQFMPTKDMADNRRKWLNWKADSMFADVEREVREHLFNKMKLGVELKRAMIEVLRLKSQGFQPEKSSIHVWREFDEAEQFLTRGPSGNGTSTKCFRKQWKHAVLARVPVEWLRWSNLGLGVVEGMFVLDVISYNSNARRAEVVVARPAKYAPVGGVEPPIELVPVRVEVVCDCEDSRLLTRDSEWRLVESSRESLPR